MAWLSQTGCARCGSATAGRADTTSGAKSAVQACDIDLEHGILHIAFNYMVTNGQKIRRDNKTNQERWNALDDVSVAFIREQLDAARAPLAPEGAADHDQRAAGRVREHGAGAGRRAPDVGQGRRRPVAGGVHRVFLAVAIRRRLYANPSRIQTATDRRNIGTPSRRNIHPTTL